MSTRKDFSRAHLLALANLVAEAMTRRGAPAHLEPLYRKIQTMLKADAATRTMIEAASYRISTDGRSITCLRCSLTSYNRNDVRERYCGHCHTFHDDPAPKWQTSSDGLPDRGKKD